MCVGDRCDVRNTHATRRVEQQLDTTTTTGPAMFPFLIHSFIHSHTAHRQTSLTHRRINKSDLSICI